MELPQVGKHCETPDCKQLDFLPFECALCKGTFCKEHMSPLAHQCSQYKDEILLERPTTTSIKSYKCASLSCSALDQVEMLCDHCAKHFCVMHRFHECHQVETNARKQLREQWKIPKEQFKQAKLAADKMIEQKLSKAEVAPESRSLALKLRLMKLKARASGDHRVPPADRVYFNCAAPRERLNETPVNPNTPVVLCKAVYVSNGWSLGKCIDAVAMQLKVRNDNKNPTVAGGGGLRLYKQDGQRMDRGHLSEALSVLIREGVVYSGENLILERGTNARLTDVDVYEFIV